MQPKMGEWEVEFRREQIHFIEGGKAAAPQQNDYTDLVQNPGYKPPEKKPDKPAPQNKDKDYLPLPTVAIDRPKAIAMNVTVWRGDTGEGVEEMVWFPKSQLKNSLMRFPIV